MHSLIALTTRSKNRQSSVRPLPNSTIEYKDVVFVTRMYWARSAVKKEVDANEVTVRFYQEIFNEMETLVEVHHKYPIDQGHQKVEE